jgi:hypothetical protein
LYRELLRLGYPKSPQAPHVRPLDCFGDPVSLFEPLDHAPGDQAYALLSAAESFGIQFWIVTDDQAIRNPHRSVHNHIPQARPASDIDLG